MRLIVLPIVGIFIVASLATSEAFAQGQRAKFSTELSTVSELALATGELSEPATACGLVVADLEKPARSILAASRMRMNQSASNFLNVKTNVVMIGSSCTASVDVELFRWSNEFSVSVSVWSHQSLITGGKDGFNARVREKVEAMTKDFIAEWQKKR